MVREHGELLTLRENESTRFLDTRLIIDHRRRYNSLELESTTLRKNPTVAHHLVKTSDNYDILGINKHRTWLRVHSVEGMSKV